MVFKCCIGDIKGNINWIIYYNCLYIYIPLVLLFCIHTYVYTHVGMYMILRTELGGAGNQIPVCSSRLSTRCCESHKPWNLKLPSELYPNLPDSPGRKSTAGWPPDHPWASLSLPAATATTRVSAFLGPTGTGQHFIHLILRKARLCISWKQPPW